MTPFLESVVKAAEQDGEVVDVIVPLQPTGPLRTAADVGGAVGLLITSRAKSIISVYQVENHLARNSQKPRRNVAEQADGN